MNLAMTAAVKNSGENNRAGKKFHNRNMPPEKIRDASTKELMEHYMAFAKCYAAKYLNSHPGSNLDYEDACEEAYCGLLKAKTMYNPKKGAAFTTYSAKWMQVYLDRALGESKYKVHVPTKKKKKMLAEKFAYDAYVGVIHPSMLNKDSMGLFHDVIKDKGRLEEIRLHSIILHYASRLSHLETPVGRVDDSPSFFGDSLAAGEEPDIAEKIHAEKLRERITDYISRLNKREQFIVRERIMAPEPKSLKEIGDAWGVSRERARQIEKIAKKKLKLMMQKDPLIFGHETVPETNMPEQKTEKKTGNENPLEKAA